jgi:hypothetical protein
VADTAEQIAYDQELANIEAMPSGDAKSEARIKFNQKYPNGRPGLTSEQKETSAQTAGKVFGFMKAFWISIRMILSYKNLGLYY